MCSTRSRFTLLFCSLIAPALTQAQDFPAPTNAPKQFRAVRVTTPPIIDGRLDEAIWQQAEQIITGAPAGRVH
ncbi:MAG: hypothetical protein WD180_02910 [Pseudohongiellaceae bacterium]